jgi:hypothetical protein
MGIAVGRNRQVLVDQAAQTGSLGQRKHRHQPSRGQGSPTVELRKRARKGMAESHLLDAFVVVLI